MSRDVLEAPPIEVSAHAYCMRNISVLNSLIYQNIYQKIYIKILFMECGSSHALFSFFLYLAGFYAFKSFEKLIGNYISFNIKIL